LDGSFSSPFADSLNDPNVFTLTYELVPGHGAGGKKIDRLLEFARRAKEDGRITALSITDNAGGHPALAPVAIGTEIRNIGLEPMVHFSLKDKNRNQVESHLFLYQRQQFRYLLVLGGDFPKQTYYGQAKPVYDLDSIQTIELVEHIKAGHYRQMDEDVLLSTPFAFQCGCVVSPFKMTEAEQIWQYAKLLKKVRAGAKFIITQLGFDLEKYAELIHFLRQEKIKIPVLANVFIPSPGVAGIMAAGAVPGVLLPAELAAQMNRETKEQRLLRAARMTAILRGLGYGGVHLGGNGLNFDDISHVLDQAEQLQDNWTETWNDTQVANKGSWSFYENKSDKLQQLHPGNKPGTRPLHQLTHNLLFSRTNPMSRTFGEFCILCDKYAASRSLFTMGEKIIKEILFSCRMCGDCTLDAATYLCPQAGCPKKLVNGPCGGSRDRKCEVFPDRLCFYVRVYCRLDQTTSLHSLADAPALPPKDWAMENSSSWINYFQGRDHTG
jgi:methylenetetrahydrofolate reductase (NADPH)